MIENLATYVNTSGQKFLLFPLDLPSIIVITSKFIVKFIDKLGLLFCNVYVCRNNLVKVSVPPIRQRHPVNRAYKYTVALGSPHLSWLEQPFFKGHCAWSIF